MTNSRPIDRFVEYLNEKGIKPAAGEKMAGLSNGFINSSMKRGGEIGSEALRKIANAFLDIRLSYIVTGEGQKSVNNGKEYDATPTAAKHLSDNNSTYEVITPVTKSGSKGRKSAPASAPPTQNFEAKTVYLTPQIISTDHYGNENIIYVNVRARAGYLNGYSDREFMETLPAFSLPGLGGNGTYRAFEVEGDSMWPTLENGEMVIGQWVEKLDYIREDRVHIIVTKHDGVVIKRVLNRIDQYGYLVCKSDAVNNRSLYRNLHIKPEDILEIWYAVWHGGFSFKSPDDLWQRQNNLEADVTEIMRRLKEAGI